MIHVQNVTKWFVTKKMGRIGAPQRVNFAIDGPALGRNPVLTATIRPERVGVARPVNGTAGRANLRARMRDCNECFSAGEQVTVDWSAAAERELTD